MRGFFLAAAINLGNIDQQIQDTARVSPLIVIPADELDKVVVEGKTGLGVEDGRVGVTHDVRRDDIVLSVAEDACHSG